MNSGNAHKPVDSNQAVPNGDAKTADHSQETMSASHPPATHSDTQPRCKQDEITCNTKRDCIDWITLGLEAFGLLVIIAYTFATIVYVGITRSQWDAMRCANALTESNYANDQRAWIGISLRQKGYQIRADAQTKRPIDILVAVDTINTGKTPAFGVHGNIAITVIKKGEQIPVGKYGPGHASYAVNGGVMFPGGDTQLARPAIKHGPRTANVIIPTPELAGELDKGESLLIVHARIDYLDIRDRPHWITFCRSISSAGLVNPECMAYNNTDKQDLTSPELKACSGTKAPKYPVAASTLMPDKCTCICWFDAVLVTTK